MNFGEKLKELRKEKGLSQKDLAEKLNVTQRTISYYENSTTAPSNAEIVTKLAVALDVRLDEFAADVGNTKIHKLIDKLKRDTENNLIHWQSFNSAYSEAEENGLHYTIRYKERFNQQNFPQYSNSILNYEQSFFYVYGKGGYLVAKFTKNETIEFALFILVDEETYIFLANSTSIEMLEDLYWSISNLNSSVTNLIDDYLNRDFAKEEAERKEQEAKQAERLASWGKDIPF